ncbi:MAG: hypothetical protein IJQ50_06345 [Clostridia bacterium]|nr:hypothetical protein [Clostridia bacterium]
MKIKNYLEARKWLRGYRLIEKEVKARMQYLDDFKKISKISSYDKNPAINKILRAIESDTKRKILKLQKRINDIEKALDKLDDFERNVLYHRYILGIEWIKLPEYILYEQRTCQLIEVRALKKIAKMNIEWSGNNDDE